MSLEGIGTVALYKRRGVRNIRLSVSHSGAIRVTIPLWAPYRLGLAFAEQKRDWILAQKTTAQILTPGQRIGKAHTLIFRRVPAAAKPSTRIVGNEVRVSIPVSLDVTADAAQTAARRACIRALKNEAMALLPQRLAILAEEHGFDYRSVKIKELKGRWGSCNQHKDIVLNCFLMQLPWDLIDYVILHELLHTRILAHGRPFWTELGLYVDDLKTVRKTMKNQQPSLVPAAIS